MALINKYRKTFINKSNLMQFHIFLDVQSDIPYAHPQRTETVHMHNVSKRILPQFRSQEGNRKSFTKYNCFHILKNYSVNTHWYLY